MAHENEDLGEKVAEEIIELDPEDSGTCIQLCLGYFHLVGAGEAQPLL